IIDVPQGGYRASGTGLDRDARQPQRGSIIASGGIAGTQSQQIQGLVAELEHPDQLVQSIHGELLIEGQEERVLDVASKVTVGGNVHDREPLFLQLLFQLGNDEFLVDEHCASKEAVKGLELGRDVR